MRAAVTMLAVLLVACAAPSPPAPAGARQAFESAFARAVGEAPRALAAALDSAPLGRQTLRTSQIAVDVEGHLGAVQTRDGGWLVQVPANGARILAYSTTEGTAGAVLNVRGTNTADVHTSQVALPRAVVPGDALVVASTGSGRGGYWDAPGRSVVDEMLAVVFVPYRVGPGLLRPPALGNSDLARFLRSIPIPESAVHVERLPSVVDVAALPVDWAAWGAAEPTIPYLTALLQPFCGECYDGWATDTRTPDHQHPGYGTAYASVVSQALVQLCSTASLDAKRPLALAVAQRGLDLVGAFCDGRRNYPLGGHSAGRKALIVLTGHMIGVEAIADPTAFLGPVFQEDGCYSTQAWWFSGWTAGWRYSIATGSKLADPPATWGPVDAVAHDSWAWMVVGYMPQVVGAQVGTALAMRLLGRTREMGTAFDGLVGQWMAGPPTWADAQLRAVGITLPWGSDYAMARGAGFCAAAWRTAAQVGSPIPRPS